MTNEQAGDATPVIHTEAIGIGENDADETILHRIDTSWSLEGAVDAFLDEFSAARSTTTYSNSGGDILVEVRLPGRSFPSMHFDHQLLNRLASTGMALRINTGPRTTA
ncbi:hypothetical protein [Nocardia mangyaensis]|uniref:hypothetical protein n=1 Tax=Nocardia mangyaensis TaxID=2213200 RepID=UPI002676A0D7|nr:hypothetical protein [Nocardia mangyaensis]MDO3649487.1 hypothetical protein [Nocardia mangyaensis]